MPLLPENVFRRFDIEMRRSYINIYIRYMYTKTNKHTIYSFLFSSRGNTSNNCAELTLFEWLNFLIANVVCNSRVLLSCKLYTYNQLHCFKVIF